MTEALLDPRRRDDLFTKFVECFTAANGGARAQLFVRQASSAQSDIERLVLERPILGIGDPGVVEAHSRERIDLRLQLNGFGESALGGVDIAPEAERARQV